MKYFVFVDESGSFDEAIRTADGRQQDRPSVVGGICGRMSAQDWEAIHRRTLEDFNANSRIKFTYPKHFHCAPLMGNKIQTDGPVRRQDCEALASAIWGAVAGASTFLFASRNPGGRFEFSPQATYVLNLITALRGAMQRLSEMGTEVETCDIMIAQRTIRETADYDQREYTASLFRFVAEQLQTGDTSGVSLVQRLVSAGALRIESGVGERNAGLIAADFSCAAVRYGRELEPKPIDLTPESNLGGDYRRFYEQEVLRLIEAQQYASAAEFLRRYFPQRDGAPDLGPLLHALRRETDHDILHRELNALLAESECLAEKRTLLAGALKAATCILESLDQLAAAQLAGESSPDVVRQWADLDVHALVLLASCYNHTGAVGPQQDVETRLNSLLKTYRPRMSLSYLQRRELVLEAKTRNLNLLFNDYRFADVIAGIEADVAVRERDLPSGETDELLGKMLGSLGQACAFQARIEPSWSDVARDYFRRSLHHFQPGTVFHSMSVNFLATLAWQENNLQTAIEEMNGHVGAIRVSGPAELAEKFTAVVSVGGISPFNVVNYLRIASAGTGAAESPSEDTIEGVRQYWEPRLINDHPHEQLAKWLGYLFFKRGAHEQAEKMYSRATSVCESLSFAVETIGVSIVGLRAINQFAQGNTAGYAENLNRLREVGSSLEARSVPFDDYLIHFGGIEGLVAMVKRRDMQGAIEVARFLPFNYA
jgi:hypothetical protein